MLFHVDGIAQWIMCWLFTCFLDLVSVQSLFLLYNANCIFINFPIYIFLCVGVHIFKYYKVDCFFTHCMIHLFPKSHQSKGNDNGFLLRLDVGKENHPNATLVKLNQAPLHLTQVRMPLAVQLG